MPEIQTYKNWKAVTEADFVSLFIKTWFAYISTLRIMFPEAYNRRGDKKYLDAYKKFYKATGYKKLIIDGAFGPIGRILNIKWERWRNSCKKQTHILK